MIQRLNLNLTLSQLSLGQCGFNLLRELYKRKVQVALFPRQVDLSAFKLDQSFGQWIERAVNNRYTKLDRKVPTLACWHLSGSELKLSDKQYLLSFHETDSITDSEANIINQQDHTFFTSNWTVENCKAYGAPNVSFVPLGLDEDFTKIDHRLVSEDVVHWILVGKVEQRKNTELIIKTWVKRYGDLKNTTGHKHLLSIAVNNPFFKPEQMNAIYQSLFNGGKPYNVNILPHLKTNAEMNQLYNSADIDLSGFSSSEGWNIPAHTATCLGKWSIVTNCTAHKDWATADNAILVEPNQMRPVYDNVFFQQGAPFSQGNVYSFSAEQLEEAMDRAEKKTRTPNPAGEKLRQTHTYKNTVQQILEKIGD